LFDDPVDGLNRSSDGSSNAPSSIPRFVDIVNYLVAYVFPPLATKAQQDKLKSDVKYHVWDDPYLWHFYNDQVIYKCILDHEI